MKFKSYSEAVRTLLGVNYYNKATKLKLLEYCKDNNIDIELTKDEKHYCLNCGKEIERRKKFCNNSCAAKYNNKQRVVSIEQKEKVSETLRKKFNSTAAGHYEQKENKHIFLYEKICPVCEKEFYTKDKRTKYCSLKCVHKSSEVNEKIRQSQLKLVENGEHKGWQSRNITSYPEKYWKDVLDNNGIEYVREDFTTKKYFLDFLIEKNGKKIDLEIDGKQHQERKEHDKERDKYLTNLGYTVYRINWNRVNYDKGQQQMQTKINDFLQFYNNF